MIPHAIRLIGLTAGLFLCTVDAPYLWAQDLTSRDNEEVKLLARRKIERGLSDLLNVLSLADLGEAERNALINESFSPGTSQLFVDKDVIVEDDVSPNRVSATAVLDVPVEKYLANFDLLYAKSPQSTILLSDVFVTNLKRSSRLYIKVFYTELFGGKHTKIDKAYVPVRRVAELQANQAGTKWSVQITRLAFANPADSASITQNDVPLREAPLNRLLAASDSILTQADSGRSLVVVDVGRKQEADALAAYQKLLTDGMQAFGAGDLVTAQQLYEQADKQKPFEDLTPKVRLFRIQRVLEERARNSVADMKKRADLFNRKRRYTEALTLMQSVINQQPDSVVYTLLVKELVIKARQKAEFDERFSAGQYRELVKEYTRLIDTGRKQNKSATADKVNNSDWYLGRGNCYTRLGDYKDALHDLNESLGLDFQNLDALESRATLYARMGDYPKAAADLSVYLTVDPGNAELLARRADYRVRTNRIAEAFADYFEAIRISNNNPAYYLLRGKLYQQTGLFDKAEADFSEGISRSRRQPELYVQRGYANVGLKQYASAGSDFSRAIELGLDVPNRTRIDSIARLFYQQSEQVLQTRKTPESMTLLETALLIKPDYADAWLAKGNLQRTVGDLKSAAESFTNAIRYNPTSAAAYYQRGQAGYRLSEYGNAATDFEQALMLQPTLHEATLGNAKARIRLRQYDRAQSLLAGLRNLRRQLERQYPATFFGDVYYLLGQCAYELRQYDVALDHYNNALAIAHNWTAAYTGRGRTYEALDKTDRARDDYIRAVQIEPTVAAHYVPLARMLEQREKYDEALREYTRGQEFDTDHELTNTIAIGKGRCLIAKDKYLEALTELDKVGQYDGLACTDECLFLRLYTQVRTGQMMTSTRLAGLPATGTSPEQMRKIRYVLACAHLQANDEAEALVQLEKAMQMGIPKDFLKKDRLLDFVRRDFRKTPAYIQLVSRYRL